MNPMLVVALVMGAPADDLDFALARRGEGALDMPAERLAALVGRTDDAGFASPAALRLEDEVLGDPRPHLEVLEDWLLRRVSPERDDDDRLQVVASLLRLVGGAEPDGVIAVALDRLEKWPWSRRDNAVVAWRVLLMAMEPSTAAAFVTSRYGERGDDFDGLGLAAIEPLLLRSPPDLARFVARADALPSPYQSPTVRKLRGAFESQRTVVLDEDDPHQVLARLVRLPFNLLEQPSALGEDDRSRLARVTADADRFAPVLASLIDAIDPHRLDETGNDDRAYSLRVLAKRLIARPEVEQAFLSLLDRLHRPPQREETRGRRLHLAYRADLMFERACDIDLARIFLTSLEWLDDEYLMHSRCSWLGNLCQGEPEVRARVRALVERRLPKLERDESFAELLRLLDRPPRVELP